jgi:hypothetical protein
LNPFAIHWLRKHLSALIFFLSLLVFLVFLFVVLPAESAKSALMTGSGDSPDLIFYYTPAELLAIADSYGVEGRAYYISSRLSFDIVWPLAYLFFMLASANLVFTKRRHPRLRQAAFWFTIAAFVFDLLENQLVSHVMRTFPSPSPFLLGLAGVATAFKWGMLALALILLVNGVDASLRSKRKTQTNGQTSDLPL